MVKVTLLALLFTYLGSPSSGLASEALAIQWFKKPDLVAERGVVLLGHGLNLKPTKMDELALFLAEEGFEVGRFSFSGHDGNLEAFKDVTYEKWKTEFLAFNEEAKRRAGQANVPLFFIGFSLSGVFGEDLVNSAPTQVGFRKVVLFAPAIAARWYTHGISFLSIFGSHFCVPSASLAEYRANDCTTIGAYRALFTAMKNLRSSDGAQSRVPTLVFIDPDDELVSESGIRSFIADKHLTEWKLNEIHHFQPKAQPMIHHLIIDEESLGKKPWAALQRDLLEFLRRP